MKKRSSEADVSPKRARRYETAPEERPNVAEPKTAPGGSPRAIAATEAARNFSDLINRVRYRGETYVVERGGRPMCEIRPIGAHRCTGAELRALLATVARPPEEFLAAVESASRGQANIEPSPWEK